MTKRTKEQDLWHKRGFASGIAVACSTMVGRKRPLLRDTLATTAKQARILAVNNTLRDYPAYGDEIENFGWRTLHDWGYRCVPIRVSYRQPTRE